MTKSKLGEERVYSGHTTTTIHRLRKSGQELKLGRNMETRADVEAIKECCWLTCSPMACSAWPLLEHRIISPGMVPPSVSSALPHQSSVMKMPHCLAHRSVWWGYCLSWGSLFPSDSKPWQVDTKHAYTIDNKCCKKLSVGIFLAFLMGQNTWSGSDLCRISCNNDMFKVFLE